MKNGKWELRIGSVLAGIVIFLAVLSFFWTPYGINEIDKTARMAAPSLQHLFGTDNLGRDVFSRAIVGGRFTLLVAVCRLRNLAGRLRCTARQSMNRQHVFDLNGIFWCAEAFGRARSSHDGKACSHGMAMCDRKVTQQFDRMGCSMAQVEQLALAHLTLVGLHHVALDGHAAFHNATFLASKRALQPLKELGVTHDAVFHDLAHAVAHKLARQGLQTAQVTDDEAGLVECADEVLSLGQVNGGLSAHAGVNHGKQ